MPFDPNRPYEVVKSGFDPNRPYEVVSEPEDITATKAATLGAAQGATFDLADEGYGVAKTGSDLLTSSASIKDALQNYRKNRDAARAEFEAARTEHPVAYGTGQVAGAVGASLIPAMGFVNAARGANALKVIAAGAKAGALGGFGGSKADLTKGDVLEAAKDTATGAAIGGGMAGAFAAAPAVAKQLIVGHKDANVANKVAAKVGSIFTDTPAEDINHWLSMGFKERNRIREFKPEEAAHALKPAIEQLEQSTNIAIQNSYQKAKDEFLAPASTPEQLAQDKDAIKNAISDILGFEDMATSRSNLYSGSTRREATSNVRDLLERGNPRDGGIPINLDDSEWLLNDPQMVSLLKERLLDAKQYLSKSKVGERFQNLSVKDQELFNDVYKSLNTNLKSAAKGDSLKAADILYSGDKTAENSGLFNLRDKFFGAMKTGGAKGEYDTSKMSNLLKTQTGRKLDFDDKLDAFTSYMEKNVEDQSWKQHIDALQSFRSTSENRALATRMKYDSGGPSSQAILNATHAGAAYGTGGLSLLSYPFTNPVGYTRMVDRLGSEQAATIAKSLTQAAGMGARTLLLTDTYLKKKYPEYEAYLKDLKDEKAKTPNLKEVSNALK